MTREEELLQRYYNWDLEIERNDVPAMSSYMSDDWVCVGGDGVTPKAAFLQSITSGDLVHTTMNTDFTRVKIYGDSAVITGRGTSAGTFKGQAFSLYEWSTNFFVFQNNQWLCVLTMLTPARQENA